MKKKIFMSMLVIVCLAAMSFTALAAPPEPNADGTMCYNLVDGTDVKVAASNIFILDFNDEAGWFGTFDGESFDEGWIVMHSGRWFFNTNVTFESVEVGGKTGGLEMRLNGWLPVTDPLDYSLYEGTWVITRATGDLRGLTGRGIWWFGATTTDCLAEGYDYGIPYLGHIRFGPD